MENKIKTQGKKAQIFNTKLCINHQWQPLYLQHEIIVQVMNYLKILKEANIKFTSGDADNLFRVYNRITYKVSKHRKVEPLSFQREIVYSKYPEIFPIKGKMKNKKIILEEQKCRV